MQTQTALGVLLDHFYKETDASVKAKIAHLLSDLVKAPNFDSVSLVDDIKTMMKSESKSHEKIFLYPTGVIYNN